MMTQTQKKFLEWPLILTILLLVQAFEVALLRLPFGLGPIHVIPVLISYLAVTRNWVQLVALTALFGFLGSSTIGFPWPLYVAALLWTALIEKAVLLTFSVEGRGPFAGLAAGANILFRLLTWFLLESFNDTLPVGLLAMGLIGSTLASAGLAWYLFPLFAAWDSYFEHAADEARELKPGALR
jgi:hypothetical protein